MSSSSIGKPIVIDGRYRKITNALSSGPGARPTTYCMGRDYVEEIGGCWRLVESLGLRSAVPVILRQETWDGHESAVMVFSTGR